MINKKYILIILLISCLVIIPSVSAANWTYNFTQPSTSIEIINSTYMKDFMYYLMVTNGTSGSIWSFPVIGLGSSIMTPFTKAFTGVGIGSGAIVYLILFGLFIMMSWRQSGKVAVPAMIAVIVGSSWAMLFPESYIPYIMMLLAVALTAGLTTWFAQP